MANYGDSSFPVTVVSRTLPSFSFLLSTVSPTRDSHSFALLPYLHTLQPPGGVREGQTFTVQYPSSADFRSEVTPFILNSAVAADATLSGRWKDELFDCFRFGPCHVTVWNSVCCPQLLMAQVLTRLKMNWRGEQAPDHEWKRTFGRVFCLVCLYWILTTVLAPPSPVIWQDPATGKLIRLPTEPVTTLQYICYHLVSWSFAFYTLVVLTKLRRQIRLRYEIPLQYPAAAGHMEDCCIAFWCGCCAVSQMARQTCDYDEQPAACCSPNGLGAPRLQQPVMTV